MDWVTSNNLSRALAGVADTVGQYARAQHEDRIEQSKLAFQQALRDQAAQQHREDKQQQRDEFNQTLTASEKRQKMIDDRQRARDENTKTYRDQMVDLGKKRLDVDRIRAGTTKADAVTQRILNTYQQRLQHASQMHLSSINEMQAKLKPNPMQMPEIEAYNKNIENQYQPQIDKYAKEESVAYTQYNDLSAKLSGVPVDDAGSAPAAPGSAAPTAPAAPAAPAQTPGTPMIKYDRYGNPWILGPNGKPIPYKPTTDVTPPDAAPQVAQANDPSVQGGITQPGVDQDFFANNQTTG